MLNPSTLPIQVRSMPLPSEASQQPRTVPSQAQDIINSDSNPNRTPPLRL